MKEFPRVAGRNQVHGFTDDQKLKGPTTMVQDRLGVIFKRFASPVKIGSSFRVSRVWVGKKDGIGQFHILFCKVLRAVPEEEVIALKALSPISSRKKLKPGWWYEIHAD